MIRPNIVTEIMAATEMAAVGVTEVGKIIAFGG